MKCPNCKTFIPEGKMYCEECGAELQIVPDADFEIQKEMDDTLSSIAESGIYDDYNEFDDDDDLEYDDDPNLLSMIISGKAGGKLFYIIFFLMLIVIIVSAVILGKKASEKNTTEYQLEMAIESISSNKYLDAATYYEKAFQLDHKTEYLFKAADCYHAIGRDNDAIATLCDIAFGEYPQSDIAESVGKIVYLYESSGNFQLISDLLKKCDNDEVKNNYRNYMVDVPAFSHLGGTYEEQIALKITSDLPGTIYYTIDGTEPTTASTVFDAPIFLDYGSYTVKAIFVNQFGVISDTIIEKYLIDVDIVFEPSILTDSGEYDYATWIEADLPVMYSMYYTTDGTEPSKESKKWTGPVPMPLGTTTFKFVAFASDGTQSEIAERIYNLTYDIPYVPGDLPTWIKNYLFERGLFIDPEGHRDGVNGTYIYALDTAYNVEGRGDYFFLVEYLNDEYGNTTRTGTIYAVNVFDPTQVHRVQKNGVMSFALLDF